MRRTLIVLTGVLLLFLASCEKYIIPPPEVPEGVSYSADVQPIFDDKCVSCHSGGMPPDLRAEFSYDELIDGGYVNTDNPEESELYTKLLGTHSSRATEEEKAIILGWITEGAQNN
jgi:hypothetical protein